MIFFIYPILQNQIINQINKYNYNTLILFFNPDAISFFLLYYCGFKKDNKRNKGKEGTSSQNSGRERRIFLFVLSPPTSPLSIPRSRSIDNSLVIPFISPYYPPCITLFTTILPPFFTSLYN